MSAHHTPEPWKDGPVFGTVARALFWTDTSKPGKWQRRLDEMKNGTFSEANARRIVACVNICAGIPTQELEEEGKDAPDLAAAIKELGEQRDELAKALRSLLKAYDSIMPGIAHIAVQDYALVNTAPIDARAALARVTKK